MTPEQYDRVREVFLAARDRKPSQRAAFLRDSCADDAVRAEVEALLRHDHAADSFLQKPAMGESFALAGPESLASRARTGSDAASSSGGALMMPHPAPPERIGQYRILDVLGQGGMGVVYRAEQENPRRTVALKVIRSGAESPALLQRFQHESQVLGCLHHPGIAQIYEAGTAGTDYGVQPFFAMELVQGQPLAAYADAQRLDARARLALLARVCDAVHHAHQKGVVHRDLKPANILVDGDGQPKVLDFGVARVTDADLRSTTLQTSAGQLIGTLAYMSPEQVAGDARELDTRSDVYALGVIGYELLSGRVPFDIAGKTIPQAVRFITEQEPALLSSINRTLRGDVAAIIGKALEKDKNRRYQSASDFAADIRRYLNNQTVSARPVTAWYQLCKFARRNKPLVAGAAATVAALLIGIGGTTYGLFQARDERNRALTAEQLAQARLVEAQRQAAIAQSVNDFLNNDLLGAADPDKEQRRDVTVRSVLDRASAAIGDRFAGQPQVEASIRQTLGDAYEGLGEYELSATHLERALELWQAAAGERHPGTLQAMTRLGWVRSAQGRYADAEQLLLAAIEGRRELMGASDSRTLTSMNHLALTYGRLGRRDEEAGLLLRVLELAQQRPDESRGNQFAALANLGDLYVAQSRYADAEPLLLKSLEMGAQLFDAEAPATLSVMSNLAKLYVEQGRYEEAERLGLQTLEVRRRVLGEEHPKTLTSVTILAVLYKRQGRFDEAESLSRQTLVIKRRVLGEEHPDTLVSLNNLASVCAVAGSYAEAESLYLQTLEVRQRVLGERHRQTLGTIEGLAELYDLQGRADEAARWRGILQTRRSTPTSSRAASEGG